MIKKLTFFLGMVMSLNLMAQTTSSVSVYLTKGNKSALLEQQPNAEFSTTFIDNNSVISVDETETYQSVVGFGWTLTQGSAKAIRTMSNADQNALLEELFHPSNGIRSSLIRISLGASDLSESTYTYNELPYGQTDQDLSEFSLNGPDKTDLIPILKKIVAINPNVRLLATPWTAPTWMKVENNSDWGGNPASANRYKGGRLNTSYYGTYANYFVKYIQAMEDEGLTIWGITPQNEPLNKHNEPSMLMNGDEQLNFVKNHLGPKLDAAGFSDVQVIAYDHNCDNTIYPIKVLASDYADGAAFHLYAGDISEMTTVHEATNKDVYFTEQWVSSSGNFGGDFEWHMKNIVVGSLRNWSRSVLEWNLAAFSDDTPRTPGGCVGCLGAVTINNDKSVTRNVAYYIIGQISKFVTEGAVRIASDNVSGGSGLSHVAFKNTDESKVALIYNDRNYNQTITLQSGNQFMEQTIPANTAVTLIWSESSPSDPEPSVDIPTNTLAFIDCKASGGLRLEANGSANPLLTGTTVNTNDVKWRVSPAPTEGYYYIDCSTYNNKRLSTNGSDLPVLVAASTTGNSVEWKFTESSASGYYHIDSRRLSNGTNRLTKKSLTAAGITDNTVTFDATKWKISVAPVETNPEPTDIPTNTLAFIDCKASGGLRLEADGSANPLLTGTTVNTNNVKWRVIPAPTEGYYYIDCSTHNNKRLSSNGSDLPVLVAASTTGNSVEWKFTESSTSGYYHIDCRRLSNGTNRLTKKSLTAAGLTDNTVTYDATRWQISIAGSSNARISGQEELISEATTPTTLIVYPSPTNHLINVESAGNEPTKIYSLTGVLVKVSQESAIDVQSLLPGVYLLQQGENIVRFIKE